MWKIIFLIVGALLVLALVLWIIGERGRLLLPSTWKSMKEGGMRRFLNFSSLHGYIYGRWTKQYLHTLIYYIVPRLKTQRQKEWLANRYHGKVLTQDQAEAVITLDRDISLQDLEQIIPYSTARDIVLEGPPEVAVYECYCRHNRQNPCRPTQVCMVVGKKFVDFVLEHHPETSRRLSKEEAVELLQAEHERGHLHSAWFKDAFMDRFYAICNCCKCCCGGIEAMKKYGIPMMASSGYVAQVDSSVCTACGICAEACPFGALSVNGATSVLDWEKCMGCGVCVEKCPNNALSLSRDEKKGLPLDVRLLV